MKLEFNDWMGKKRRFSENKLKLIHLIQTVFLDASIRLFVYEIECVSLASIQNIPIKAAIHPAAHKYRCVYEVTLPHVNYYRDGISKPWREAFKPSRTFLDYLI